jgi:CRISPR-associated protein Csd1
MILQALKEYYDRKASDPESDIAPPGWEWKEIPFILILDEKGNLLQIDDTREGQPKRGKKFLVPQAEKKASGIKANLLWDSPAYVLGKLDVEGLSDKEKKRKQERLPEQKAAFIERIRKEIPDNPKRNALLSFLEHVSEEDLSRYPSWPEILKTNANLSFKFHNENDLYCRSPEIIQAIDAKLASKPPDGICLVTGEEDVICTLHNSIKGVQGAQSSGANIVSFNLDAFCSYNKEQGKNAPVGYQAMFAYTTALNTLLSRESRQRLVLGEAVTYVFWSSQKTDFEADFSIFFSEPAKDDPDAGTETIRSLLMSPLSGSYRNDTGNEKFYILGLSPNASRLAIQLWLPGTVSYFKKTIAQHFEDFDIKKSDREPRYYSLWRIVTNIVPQDKSENIPPPLVHQFMYAILTGSPYPETLLQSAIRRIRSDVSGRVTPVRAALIKAYLNRYIRYYSRNKEKELTMGLDMDQPSIGYQLGRLFATLEKIQEEANPGINATIRERYYGSACSNPVAVFPTLMRLKNHHLAKLENEGRAKFFERLIGEIVGKFNDFPAHLNIHEQGRFAVGYYHQRQDFYSKKD